jgi:protein TonB
MIEQVFDTGWGWKSWTVAILASLALHGLILGSALLMSRDTPRPRRVVTVEPICLTTGSGHAGGGANRVEVAKPQAPPKSLPVKEKPKPVKPKPAPKPPEILPAPELAMPRPAAAVTPRPGPVASVPSTRGSGGGGPGAGAGQGAGRGSGPGTGLGTGSGPGSDPGPGSGSGTALKSYLAQVRRLLEKNKTYPWMARRQHQQGVVVLKFTIGKGGAISGHTVARSSGHEVLDGAAKETLQKVGRFPPLPDGLGRSQLTVEVPLAFRLTES